MSKKLKRVLSAICTLTLLLGMAILPGNAVYAENTDNSVAEHEEAATETYREVTFSDFGILDQTIPSGNQLGCALAGVENLDGIAFTGFLQMGLQADMLQRHIPI